MKCLHCFNHRCNGRCQVDYVESPIWGRVCYQPQPAAEVKKMKITELLAKVKTFRRPNHYGSFCGCESCLLYLLVAKLDDAGGKTLKGVVEKLEAEQELCREVESLRAANKSANESTTFAQKQLAEAKAEVGKLSAEVLRLQKQPPGYEAELAQLRRELKNARDERNAAVDFQRNLRDEAQTELVTIKNRLIEVEKERDGLVKALAALGNNAKS